MSERAARNLKLGGVVVLVTLAVACAPKAPPPPPPPPPPAPAPVVYVPPRPKPPLGASPLLEVPRLAANGVRQTVNAGISPAQTVWNLRSAYNVAALNCLKPEHADILVGYKAFLKTHARALTTANRNVDADFRTKFGSAFVRPREAYMTQVYNHYAFPPTVNQFCDAALAMARESKTVKSAELTSFAQRSVSALDLVFENFYRSYEAYKVELAAWDARYGTPAAPAATAK
jgi:hypothetical protein